MQAAAEADRLHLDRQTWFRVAVEAVAQVWSRNPSVDAVSVFGSVAKPLVRHKSKRQRWLGPILHECAGIDVALFLNSLSEIGELRKTLAQTLDLLCVTHPEKSGVNPHHFTVYIIEPETLRYRGCLCHFGTCPKESRLHDVCRVDGCGAVPFLRQVEDWKFVPGKFLTGGHVKLYDRNHGGLLKPEYPVSGLPRPAAISDDDVPF